MTDTKFDLLVTIMRAQPFHNEHKRIVDEALERSDKVLILLGSAGKARSIRNPFTYQERHDIIRACYPDSRIFIEPLYDKMYNDTAWVEQVQTIVKEYQEDGKIGLIGASKDKSSYYLKLFPQWESVDVGIQNPIHATGIREGLFNKTSQKCYIQDTIVPKPVSTFLFNEFIKSEHYTQLVKEHEFVVKYKKAWEAAPYPVKHVTVDALVEQSGHVLLVKRKAEPGKGLWALPGGHLDPDEKISDGWIRELREETKLKVPEPVLRGSVVAKEVFDDVHRSTIGRVVTHAFHIRLTNSTTLPKIKGSDDAEKAKWIPISDLKEELMFDDHFGIICYMLGIS